MRTRISVLACFVTGTLVFSTSSASAADSIAITSAFTQLTSIPTMANPSVIVLDEKTGDVLYESNAYSPRKPASVLKIISAAAAYTYLAPSDSFSTTVYTGADAKSIVIKGSFDPWISYDHKVAEKMGRTSLQRIEYNSLNQLKEMNNGSTKETTIYYSGLNTSEVNHIKGFLKKQRASTQLKRVSANALEPLIGVEMFTSTSPSLQKIVDWVLTWSDNLLADRVARIASVAAGNSRDDAGVAKTFDSLLTSMGISTSQLVVKDASGLSRENRVTARQISQLLFAIHHNPKYAPIVTGLPVGGVTGTLQSRFVDTAPGAVGLVRAKTGTLNGTTNLAGFVESGDHEYIFVIIADQHSRSYSVTKKVRATVDRVLGKIAKPLLPTLMPTPPLSETVTVTN
jgi:D-alanyl-D-alanine carboxypeptidase/D-alanyl-D-alanine-endopeptidase (penicillin-binding protein 4)